MRIAVRVGKHAIALTHFGGRASPEVNMDQGPVHKQSQAQ